MRGRKGFTLIELVVVIAVLGILAAIGIPRMVESFKISRGHRMIADLRLLDSAIGYYIALHGEPPESLTVLTQEPQIIAAVPEKLSADFIVKQNSGTEKEYTGAESWNYGINPETNRAYYGGSGQENQSIEFYLFGESSGETGGTGGGSGSGLSAQMSALDTLIKTFHQKNEPAITGITGDNDYCEQLRNMGFGASSINYVGSSKEVSFLAVSTVTVPEGSGANTLVPVLYVRYEPKTGSYMYMAAVGAVGSASQGDIQYVANVDGMYGSEANKDYKKLYNYTSQENALARYENILKGYNEGLLTATPSGSKYIRNYVVDEQGNVTKSS